MSHFHVFLSPKQGKPTVNKYTFMTAFLGVSDKLQIKPSMHIPLNES